MRHWDAGRNSNAWGEILELKHFIFILWTSLYSLRLTMYIRPFWWTFLLTVKEFSFSCICSINNKELGIRLTSGRPQTAVNKRSGSKNKVAPVNFKADILWNTDHYYYYGLLCRMLSVPNTFRNFILQFFNLYLMTFSSTLLNWRCAVLLTVSIACCFSDVKYAWDAQDTSTDCCRWLRL